MRASDAILQSWKEPKVVFRAQLQFVGSDITKHMETCERIKLDIYQHGVTSKKRFGFHRGAVGILRLCLPESI